MRVTFYSVDVKASNPTTFTREPKRSWKQASSVLVVTPREMLLAIRSTLSRPKAKTLRLLLQNQDLSTCSSLR